jgi:hypothetical protein
MPGRWHFDEHPARTWIEATAGYRGDIRRELFKNGFDFVEQKGWWTSVFFVYGSDDDIHNVRHWLAKIN